MSIVGSISMWHEKENYSYLGELTQPGVRLCLQFISMRPLARAKETVTASGPVAHLHMQRSGFTETIFGGTRWD